MMKGAFDLIIFTDHFPYGNSESFLSDELQFLSEAFKNILIVPIDTSGGSPKRYVPKNITIHPPPFKNLKSKSLLIYKGLFNLSPVFPFFKEGISHKVWKSGVIFRNWATSIFLMRSLAAYFRSLLHRQSIGQEALLYFYWGLRWSQVIPFLPARFNRIFIRMHGSDLYEELNNNYIPFRHEQIKRAKGVFLISRMAIKYFLSKYPFMADKTYFSPLGSHDQGLNPNQHKISGFHIVSCSNMVPVKRIHLLAESLNFIKNQIVWTHFGTGSERELIQDIINKAGNNFRAELKGWVSHAELMHYYATTHIDLFLNTSSSEGVPVSVMEALSFGIPVIATDVGGTSEILDSSCGKLIPVNISAKLLADEIDSFLSKPDLENYRINARYSWEKTSNCSKFYPEFVELLTTFI